MNLTRKAVLAERVREARTFFSRMRGWPGGFLPQPGDGLYLAPCNWVHMLMLPFALDALYVDRRGVVVAVRTLEPGRIGPCVLQAAGVLEVPAGICARLNCRRGDQLACIDAPARWRW